MKIGNRKTFLIFMSDRIDVVRDFTDDFSLTILNELNKLMKNRSLERKKNNTKDPHGKRQIDMRTVIESIVDEKHEFLLVDV